MAHNPNPIFLPQPVRERSALVARMGRELVLGGAVYCAVVLVFAYYAPALSPSAVAGGVMGMGLVRTWKVIGKSRLSSPWVFGAALFTYAALATAIRHIYVIVTGLN